MDSGVSLWLDRAETEILAARSLKKPSEDDAAKKDFGIPAIATFYSGVISHAYYAIFYSARAALLSKKREISSPNIHKNAFHAFKKIFVDTGILDKHLLEVYEDVMISASDLLQIMKKEKSKRGDFTYQTLPQANKQPAEESLNNAILFVSRMKSLITC